MTVGPSQYCYATYTNSVPYTTDMDETPVACGELKSISADCYAYHTEVWTGVQDLTPVMEGDMWMFGTGYSYLYLMNGGTSDCVAELTGKNAQMVVMSLFALVASFAYLF